MLHQVQIGFNFMSFFADYLFEKFVLKYINLFPLKKFCDLSMETLDSDIERASYVSNKSALSSHSNVVMMNPDGSLMAG